MGTPAHGSTGKHTQVTPPHIEDGPCYLHRAASPCVRDNAIILCITREEI